MNEIYRKAIDRIVSEGVAQEISRRTGFDPDLIAILEMGRRNGLPTSVTFEIRDREYTWDIERDRITISGTSGDAKPGESAAARNEPKKDAIYYSAACGQRQWRYTGRSWRPPGKSRGDELATVLEFVDEEGNAQNFTLGQFRLHFRASYPVLKALGKGEGR